MIEIKAPNKIRHDKPAIFLAGSIEMGVAEMWQDRVTKALSDLDIIVLNPRRDDWDASWTQSIDNPQFFEQVSWEHDGLEAVSVIVFYFDPNTKSPITLMELGMATAYGVQVIVCCPDGFWRKGNVDILCKRNEFTMVDSLEELINETRKYTQFILE
jgi:hypothetical protein